jgi:hypothetical protein
MKEGNIERPATCTEDHLEYLDELRESGLTNMFGARPYLHDAYPELSKQESGDILVYWMKTFADRHGLNEEE